ncbi:MAG TPA: zinc ribbon domain-containing protein [Pyrinomonadaceae bacterium]|nr:zinc ribbon domain-containing protein [Pyrinomonadaceae bacterium]
MYCPQCGTESQSTQYCRVCGANLKVIGKAVTLSEAIARSDRGPLPKFKEMVKGLKAEHLTEEVSRALDRMDHELGQITSDAKRPKREHSRFRRKKTPAERREQHLTKGIVSFCSGIGLSVFLYFLSTVLVLKLPPDVIARIPFEIEPVVRIIWLLGLLPTTAGVGHILAGLLIRPEQPQTAQLDEVVSPPRELKNPREVSSVTERTTNLLS